MSEPIEQTATGPTGRQLVYGLGFVLALALAIPAALFVAFSASCACTSPADLIVLNYAHEEASVTWQSPGPLGLPVFGISGSAVAPACTTHAETLRPGQVSVTISVSGVARTVAITVPEREAPGGGEATVIIWPDGQVSAPMAGPPAGGYPQDPLCD